MHLEQGGNWCAVVACAAIPTSLALANISMALVALCWLLSAGRAQRWQILRHQPVAWLCVALFSWILVGGIYSTGTPAEIGLHLKKYTKLLIAAALMGTLVDEQWRKRCVNGFCFGMAIVLLTKFGEIYWDLPWAVTHNQGWNTLHTAFGDYITEGIMLSFMLGIALWRAFDSANSSHVRWCFAVVSLLCVYSLMFMTIGRTGYVLMFLVILLILLLRWRGRVLSFSLLGFVAAFTLTLFASQNIQERIKEGYREASAALQSERKFNSLGGRVENYRQSLQLIGESPIWGWGTGSFHGQACRVASTPEMCQRASWHPHNQYFLFGIQGGLIAIALFLAVMVVAARQIWRAPPEQRAIGLVFLLIFAVDSLFNSALFSARESHLFTVMLAVVLAGSVTPARTP